MFRTSSGFDKLLDKATSNLLLEVDIFSVVQICDLIRQKDCPPKYALTALKRKLSSPNPHTVYYSLQVLESIVKNCGSPIHDEISTKEFMESLRDLAKSTPHENVREKILELVQTWAHAFRKYPNYRAVQDVLNIMKAEGMKFPSLIEADTMFTADTAPEWQDGGCCNRCRVEFGLMNRKHHCRACGQIFCGKCSSKVTPLPKFGIEKEVRVCDSCFDKFGTTTTGTSKPSKTVGNSELLLDDPLQKAIEASIADQTSKGSFNKDKKNNKAKQSSTTAPTTTPTRKTPAELEQEENEQLELALAISQSEAEAKEREKMERNNKRQQIGQLVTQSPEVISNGTNSILKKENQSPTGGIIDENNSSSSDPDLSRYLNRSYWEERQKSTVNETSAPINSISSLTPSAPMKETNSNRNKSEQSEELDNFVAILREQIDMFVNRMKSDSSRGRHISNDTSVQGLFMNLTAMHSQLLNYIHLMDDGRSFYESLQDKLTQSRDARDALDSLRNEHTALRRAAAEEAERQRQIQMAIKLNDMRQKKHQYLQYQQNLAIQRVQEEQRVMQQRMEMQRGGLMGQIPGQPQQQQGYYNYQGIHGQGGQVIPGQVHGQMPGITGQGGQVITGQVHGQMPGITGQYQMTGQHHQIQGNMMMGGVPNPIQQQQQLQPLDQQQHPQQQQQHYAYHHPAGAGQNQSVQGQVQGPMQDPGQLHINQNQQQQQQYYIPQHQQPPGGMPTTTSPPDLNNVGQGQGQPQMIQQQPQPPPQQSQQVEIANLIDF